MGLSDAGPTGPGGAASGARPFILRASRTLLRTLAILVPLGLAPGSVHGQRAVEVGGHASYATELAGGSVGAGARLTLSLAPIHRGLRLMGSADAFFPDCGPDCHYREGNLNLVLERPGRRADGGSLFGVGVNLQNFQDRDPGDPAVTTNETEIGMNLLVAFALEPRGPFQPLLEARYELLASDGLQQLVVSLGFLL